MRILCSGGGSIGHVAPCVAVIRALQTLAPDTVIHMACSPRKEDREFLSTEHIDATPVTLARLSVRLPFTLPKALREASALLSAFRPDAVFCKGGAVSLAVAWEAKKRGIPIVLHESDATMGRANRLIARWASSICLGMQDAEHKAQDARYVLTGNPVRDEVSEGNREEGLRLTGLRGAHPVLLVLGGSQGSRALNDAVIANLDALLNFVEIIHLTGHGKSAAAPHRNYWSAPFAHETLPHLYAAADMALSRSGAGSISELAANGIPSLLVPLLGVAQNHQQSNALAAALSGGCTLVPETQLPSVLVSVITDLTRDDAKRERMAQNIRTLAYPDAAKDIAGILLKLGARKA